MIWHPLIIVTATVFLGVLSAILLKEASSRPDLSWSLLGLLISAVLFVNVLRFVLWGVAHRKHPLSLTYLMNSLFFPSIFVVGHFLYGEPVTVTRVIGVALIVAGIAVITYFDDSVAEG